LSLYVGEWSASHFGHFTSGESTIIEKAGWSTTANLDVEAKRKLHAPGGT